LQNPRDGSRALGVSYPEADEEALVPIFGRLVDAAERNFAQLVAARKVELKAQREADEKKRIIL
jgi:hypothetical protein